MKRSEQIELLQGLEEYHAERFQEDTDEFSNYVHEGLLYEVAYNYDQCLKNYMDRNYNHDFSKEILEVLESSCFADWLHDNADYYDGKYLDIYHYSGYWCPDSSFCTFQLPMEDEESIDYFDGLTPSMVKYYCERYSTQFSYSESARNEFYYYYGEQFISLNIHPENLEKLVKIYLKENAED